MFNSSTFFVAFLWLLISEASELTSMSISALALDEALLKASVLSFRMSTSCAASSASSPMELNRVIMPVIITDIPMVKAAYNAVTATVRAAVPAVAVYPLAANMFCAIDTIFSCMANAVALIVDMEKAALSAVREVTNLPTLVTHIIVCAAMVTNGIAPCTSPPSCSLMSPNVFSSCFCRPASVLASSSFMFPTLAVMTSASMAARSLSVPNCSTCFCASSKVMPTRCSTSTCPCIALPIMLPMLTAS